MLSPLPCSLSLAPPALPLAPTPAHSRARPPAQVCLAVNAVILLPVEGFGVFSDAMQLVGVPYLFFKCVRSAVALPS